MSKQRAPKESWMLVGRVCLGRHWDEDCAYPFKITVQAFGKEHARSIFLERLKASLRRAKEKAGVAKILLRDVEASNGRVEFRLLSRFCNDSIFFAKSAKKVFANI